MANYSIRIDLQKLAGAFVTNLKGSTAVKRCLVIPVDDAGLYVGEKGVYLNVKAHEMQEERFGDSHCIKQSIDKARYETMTEEERRALPILGGMHALQALAPQPQTQTAPTMGADAFSAPGIDETPLPF